jgi:hypothetical protein
VEYIPELQAINSEIFQLDFTVNYLNDKINLSLEYYFKKSTYYPEEYQLIKSYFELLSVLGNEKIVLVSK